METGVRRRETENLMKRILYVLILTSVLSLAKAEERTDSLARSAAPASSITIQTNVEGARVFLDSNSVGVTPLTIPVVALGKHRIKLIQPDVESWLNEPIVDSLLVQSGEPQMFRYSFNRKFLVLSSPTGAEVFSNDSLVGTTPMLIKTELPHPRLKKQGFEEATIDIANAKRGISSTQLKRVWQSGAEESIFKDSETNGSSLRLYITGATTILAGAASAYFKVKADNSYSQYVRTGDPNQLSEVNRLDTAAGIALAATQISLGLFTYFILSE